MALYNAVLKSTEKRNTTTSIPNFTQEEMDLASSLNKPVEEIAQKYRQPKTFEDLFRQNTPVPQIDERKLKAQRTIAGVGEGVGILAKMGAAALGARISPQTTPSPIQIQNAKEEDLRARYEKQLEDYQARSLVAKTQDYVTRAAQAKEDLAYARQMATRKEDISRQEKQLADAKAEREAIRKQEAERRSYEFDVNKKAQERSQNIQSSQFKQKMSLDERAFQMKEEEEKRLQVAKNRVALAKTDKDFIDYMAKVGTPVKKLNMSGSEEYLPDDVILARYNAWLNE